MSIILEQPSPVQQIALRRLFKEDLTDPDKDLESVKSWLKKQPHLPKTWDEEGLLTFLRASFFSIEQCKKRLDLYFTMRNAVPEFFSNRCILTPGLQQVIKLVDGCYMPKLTPEGGRVGIGRAANPDIDTPNLDDFFKLIFMYGDYRILKESSGAFDVYVLDAGLPLAKHFMKVSLFTIKKFLVIVQDAYPLVIKQIHIINATQFIYFIISTLKPFLNETLKNAIHVHTEMESLYEYVPRDVLPEEYGGSGGKLLDIKAQWIKGLEEFGDWFKAQESVKADESKRPDKIKTANDLFGIDGSFKQLSID